MGPAIKTSRHERSYNARDNCFFLKDEALRATAFPVGGGVRARLLCRDVVPGGAGGAMAHTDFVRSVNPISTRCDRLSPSNYYWHPLKLSKKIGHQNAKNGN